MGNSIGGFTVASVAAENELKKMKNKKKTELSTVQCDGLVLKNK